MIQDGVLSEAQALEAAYQQKGDIWDQAVQMMMTTNGADPSFVGSKGFSMLLGSTLGTGFKQRTKQDVVIDQFYNDLFKLKGMRSLMSPSEYSMAWVSLREQYPFMDTMLLTRKAGYDKEEAFAYSVMGRVPPAQMDDFAKAVGMDQRLLTQFIEKKGSFENWQKTDKDRFMASIVDLGATLAVPPSTTRHDWEVAKKRYGSLMDIGKQQFGPDIEDKVSNYYGAKNVDDETANQYLETFPEVRAFLDWKSNAVLSDETLRTYYGGIDFYQKFLTSQMYSGAAKQFGNDIFDKVSAYFEVKDNNGNTQAMLAEMPEIRAYFDYKTKTMEQVSNMLAESGSFFPESPAAIVRPDANAQSLGAVDVVNALREVKPTSNVSAMASQYMTKPTGSSSTGDFSITNYVNEESEKRWPGITRKIQQFEALVATNNVAAKQIYEKDPTIQMYYEFGKAARKQYNAGVKGKFTGGAVQDNFIGTMQSGTMGAMDVLQQYIQSGAEVSPELLQALGLSDLP
jgi:hypothetical protein